MSKPVRLAAPVARDCGGGLDFRIPGRYFQVMEIEETGDRWSWVPGTQPRHPLTELTLAYPPRTWMTHGTCAQPGFIAEHGYDFMFRGGHAGGHPARKPKAVCADCPVRLLCENAGKDEPWGIWGGTTRSERLDRGGGLGLPYDEETGRIMAGTRWPLTGREAK